MNLITGMAWTVNNVGGDVCKRLDGQTDEESLFASLRSSYRVAEDVLRRDLDQLLEDLQKWGLVQRT